MATRSEPLWALQGLCKSFPGVKANDQISLELHAGEIHGLLGENGCGKSTLIKLLSGVIQPDEGAILYRGSPVRLSDPTQARAHGVATVFQEFSLVPQLSVAENIVLGRHPSKWGGLRVDWPAIAKGAREILAQLDIPIDPAARVADLSVAEQQLVEIAKALSQEAELLILDEPTTALGQDEIAVLHRLLRRMKTRGVAILYISHRLDEVCELVDAVTILKDGRIVSRSGETRLDVHEIVARMMGTEVGEHYPKERHATRDVVLQVEGLRTANRVHDVSFDLHRGEVLGLGGVIGAGRTEIARALFGVDRLEAGEVLLDGRPLRLRGPADAIRAGLALVPENRKFDGLFFNFFAGPNITTANLGGVMRGLRLDHAEEGRVTADYIRELEITPLARHKPVGQISGGNQQKVLIARWLFAQARILILDEPTQGIDVGAKLAVYRLINRLTAAGKSIVLISSDHNELIAMSDRIAIVQHGRVTALRDAAEVRHADLVSASQTQHAAEAESPILEGVMT
ncbi:sugar ABC transporter ATP-binding protein [Variovorax sp. PBL-E5]|uniref:sugar ABC transporter ATP-binding protein n=1 Tax=Variovorax sp. PBL-E5 TaxID=434014 RepID=UPI001316678E|nr:sugar ABC transporter ATP-binding protein [Variovorax sp. PBL-E5]VTU38167.1 Galactose/methyl galactoside import ATP-binding protein MglA [Variovorax sp. PBL-E5]